MDELLTAMSVYSVGAWYLHRPDKHVGSSGIIVTVGHKQLCENWELNLEFLWKSSQCSSEPSLWSLL